MWVEDCCGLVCVCVCVCVCLCVCVCVCVCVTLSCLCRPTLVFAPSHNPGFCFEALSAGNTGWHRSQEAKAEVTAASPPCVTHVQAATSHHVCSICAIWASIPSSLTYYTSVSYLLPSFSHTSPGLSVQSAPGLLLSPAHIAAVNLYKPPHGSRSVFIKMHSDWQEAYLHIKLTST